MGAFHCKEFTVVQDHALMKVGTDAIMLGAWVKKTIAASKHILDIGTGTGIISLMMAQAFPEAKIVGVELDELALKDARRNFQDNWHERLELVEGKIQDYFPKTHFDLIVSNPPFYSGGTLSHNASRNAVRHTLKMSHNDLLRSVQRLISKNGYFTVVLPNLEGHRFIEIARSYGLYVTHICHVRGTKVENVNRLLLVFRNTASGPPDEDQLVVRQPSGDYTDAYKKLCSAYLLD